MTDEVEEFLEHYGIPGMKWGRRKAASTSSTGSSAPAARPGVAIKLPGTGGKQLEISVHPDAMNRLIKAEGAVVAAGTVAYAGYKIAKKIDKSILLKNTNRLVSDAKTREMAGRILSTAKDIPYSKIARGVYKVTTLK